MLRLTVVVRTTEAYILKNVQEVFTLKGSVVTQATCVYVGMCAAECGYCILLLKVANMSEISMEFYNSEHCEKYIDFIIVDKK